ncbi:alpha/beta hydrolase [Actinophytocola sp.]|uniref:alpha/beta fold hydrolase n=1 Tax=Actinophytocola sp. TaxID=1872138 RepID=UPI002D33255B|nr:alpha/beta hydrolase [Actinophytocola sp.]HYQ62475.1 alpha/beta hydrolase [Actinophytocola sp.]
MSHYVVADGIRTHYRDAGDGPVVVLLHGGEYGAAAELTWESCIPLWSTQFRVLALDLVGFGRSSKLRDFAGGQRRLMIAQVSAVLRTLDIQRAYFVGTSLTGRMLLDMVNRDSAPWPIEAVVAAGIGLAPPSAQGRKVLEDFDGTLDGLRPSMEVLFHDPAFRDSEDFLRRRYEFAAMPGAWETGAAAALRSPVRARGGPQPARDYGSIRVPVQLIRGEHDALVPADTWQALADQIPGARTVTVAGSGHYPQIERPAEFAAAVLEFLNEVAT